MVQWFYSKDHIASKEGWPRTSAVEDATEHLVENEVKTILDNLVEIEVLVEYDRAGQKYIRNHRTGQNFFAVSAMDWVPVLDDEIERLLTAIREQQAAAAITDGGPTLREVAEEAVADLTLSLEGELLEQEDDFDRLEVYDGVVNAIDRNDDVEKPDSFGAMGIRNVSNKYALSELATAMLENESLSDYM